ncbi:hypothetical protein, partial [Burkholderia ubonensis]|uniref:hypothetical protein n=1 Tax=Burkholderia ubonensis TaxID=101571 RepID=UPI001E5AA4FE
FLNGQNTTFLKSYYIRFGDNSRYVNFHRIPKLLDQAAGQTVSTRPFRTTTMHPHRIVEDSGRTQIPTRLASDQIGQRSTWLGWLLCVFRAFKRLCSEGVFARQREVE